MTKTKLKIIGPYTPEHPGPFCTRKKQPVEIAIKKDRNGNIQGYKGDDKDLTVWEANGQFDHTRMSDTAYDLMNAREVPVAREWYLFFGGIFDTKEEAIQRAGGDFSSIIHVREVLPGDDQ